MGELPIRLERNSGISLESQLVVGLRKAILDGSLRAGDRLPSTRELAKSVHLSRNLVVAVYETLQADGYVESRRGSGTFVAAGLTAPGVPFIHPAERPRWMNWTPAPCEPPSPAYCEPSISFELGRPSLETLALDAWRRAWEPVRRFAPPADYGDPAGIPELRSMVAAYVRRKRAIACGADDVIITSGAVQAASLLAFSILGPGSLAAIEEPGYPAARQALGLTGATLTPVPVDEDGLIVDRLPEGADAPLLVYVTPSHQYPLGVRMSIGRRMALLEWARRNQSLIIEDDYDGEFRFDAEPLPALASLDQDDIAIYVGTFSKIISPALRVGYLIAHQPLRERLLHFKRIVDHHTPWPVQSALAAFVGNGDLDRHVRRVGRRYAEKRRRLQDALRPVEDLARLKGLEAGLHVFLRLRPDIDAGEVVDGARRRGVLVAPLAEYYATEVKTSHDNGLLLGYGGLSNDEISAGAAILVEVIREVAARSKSRYGPSDRSENLPRSTRNADDGGSSGPAGAY